MNATERRIDDQDKSVDYSEPFLGVGSKDWSINGGSNEYMNTTSLTHKKGASAKLTFTGSSVAVYGTVSASNNDSGTSSQYLIDGSTSGTYTTKPAKDAQYGVKFFQSNTLRLGQHTLEVANETKDGWLWLDYFVVSQEEINSTSTTASTTAASTSSTSAMSTTFTPSPDILPSITSSHSVSTVYVGTSGPSTTASSEEISGPTGGSRHGPPAGVIFGAIIGSIFGILFITIIIWFVRRKLADRFADEAAVIPVSAAKSPSSTYKLAFSPPRASPPNIGNMIQDHRGYEPNTPVRASKGYPFGNAVGRVQTSSYYQNHASQLPLSAIPQLQPCSRPASSHSSRNVATPDMKPTQTDVFSAGNQRQSSYIPPPAYPGPPGLHIEIRPEKEATWKP